MTCLGVWQRGGETAVLLPGGRLEYRREDGSVRKAQLIVAPPAQLPNVAHELVALDGFWLVPRGAWRV